MQIIDEYIAAMKEWWRTGTGYDLTLITKVEERNEELEKGIINE